MEKRQFLKIGIVGIGALTLSTRKSAALEYYPNKSEKKWAVLYGTWCGSSRDAGVWISEGMDGIANVFDVRENPDLSMYDHIIIGGAIRSGKVSEQLQSYLEKNRTTLKNKVRGLFAVCGNGMRPVGPEQKTAMIDNHLAKMWAFHLSPQKYFLAG